MKKEALLLFLFTIIIVIPFVEGNFVCGSVQSPDNFSPSWLKVTIFYLENPLQNTTCQVSPSGNKFCCDPLEIQGVNWAVGKTIAAKTEYKGLVAPQVNLTISGEGFDVFPPLILRRVLNLSSTKSDFIFNSTNYTIGIATAPEFQTLSYTIENSEGFSEGLVCDNCNSANFPIPDLSYGTNKVKFTASNGEITTTEEVTLHVLEYANFKRSFSCPNCRKNAVLSETPLEMTLVADFSHPVEGEISDYFPKEWALLESQNSEDFTQTHNKLSWDFKGTHFEKTYKMKSPKTLLTKSFEFSSSFDKYESFSDDVMLYKYYRFLPLRQVRETETREHDFYQNFAHISEANPLVLETGEKIISQVAVFPSTEQEEKYVFLDLKSQQEFLGAEQTFVIGTDVSDISSVLIKFSLEKTRDGKKISAHNLYFYDRVLGEWRKINSEEIDNQENTIIFQSKFDKVGSFAIEVAYE